MINALLQGIFSLIIALVNIILSPIDLLINQFLPGLGTAFSYITNFFNYLGSVVSWVISYTGVSSELLTIIVDLIVFIYTVPYMIHAIKLALKWYNTLKP